MAPTSHGYETELRTGDGSPFGSSPSMAEALGRLLGSWVCGVGMWYSPRTGQIQPGVQGHPVSEHSTFCMAGEEPE